jgi:hypothetical protein
MSEEKDLENPLLNPENNELIPQDRPPSLGPIVSMSLEQMADALRSTEAYPSDLGDGLKLDRGPVGKDGLCIFRAGDKNGLSDTWHIVRDLFTLTTEELEKIRKFLESGGNDLIPS